MKLYSIKDHAETVSFAQAVKQGMGKNQGLFFPSEINPIDDIDALLEMNLVDRSRVILQSLIGDEFSEQELHDIVASAFNFPAPVTKVNDKISALELFHGPTLAFKDFGGRFMAQCLSRFWIFSILNQTRNVVLSNRCYRFWMQYFRAKIRQFHCFWIA